MNLTPIFLKNRNYETRFPNKLHFNCTLNKSEIFVNLKKDGSYHKKHIIYEKSSIKRLD